jgi:hypothetical protein
MSRAGRRHRRAGALAALAWSFSLDIWLAEITADCRLNRLKTVDDWRFEICEFSGERAIARLIDDR